MYWKAYATLPEKANRAVKAATLFFDICSAIRTWDNGYSHGCWDRIKCVDGTTLSVQAGHGLYCTPRDDIGPYTHVEVGFPSKKPPSSWDSYRDAPKRKSKCDVWGYVPISLVGKYVFGEHGYTVLYPIPAMLMLVLLTVGLAFLAM